MFSPASGGCWVGKEYIMTLILWQNKELHQGQCHTLFQMGLHPTHSSSCYRTVQLLLWRTTPITSLHPLSQRKKKGPQQTRNFSGVTLKKKNKEIKKLNAMSSDFIIRMRAASMVFYRFLRFLSFRKFWTWKMRPKGRDSKRVLLSILHLLSTSASGPVKAAICFFAETKV